MKRLLFLCLAVIWAALASAEVALPPLTARVTDLTGTLAAEQRAGLEAHLAQIEARKGTQIAVLMLSTTQPEAIEQFGIRLAEAWKIGRKGTDDGVIVIVAKDDRRMRIEVGYGLEGALNDATAARILAERMAPRFRDGDYAGGLRAGADAIAAVVEGEALPAPAARRAAASDGDNWLTWIVVALLFASFARRVFGGFGALAAAGAAGFFAFTAFGLLVALAVGVIVFLLSFVPPGLFLGGGRGGLGGGRGGFSGGGGGFGGGGASGRW